MLLFLTFFENLELCKSAFGSVCKAADIRPVRVNYQKRHTDSKENNRVVSGDIIMEDIIPETHERRQGDCCHHGAERNVAGKKKSNQEKSECDADINRGDGDQHTRRRVNAFAAAKVDEYRPDMSDNSRRACDEFDDGCVFKRRSVSKGHFAGKHLTDNSNRKDAFENVKELHDNSPFDAKNTENVGAAHIPAAFVPYVESEKQPADNHAGRYGAGKITQRDNDRQYQNRAHSNLRQ